MKICSKCKVEKDHSQYRKDKKSKDGFSHACKLCKSLSDAEYYARNRDRLKSKSRAYYSENKDALLSQKKEYNKINADSIQKKTREYREKNELQIKLQKKHHYQANKERILENSRLKYKLNPDQYTAYGRARKARKRNAEGRHGAADVRAIFEGQRGLCANCHTKLLKSGVNKYHVDHIIPLARGGSNWPSNLQCLCPACNLSKNAKDPIKWAQENGRLL